MCSSPKSSPTGPTIANVGEEARREREMHGRAAQHPLPLAERGADAVERDGADNGQRHERGILVTGPRRVKAIQLEEFGGPEELRIVEVPDPEPGEGEVVVDVARAG